MPDVEVDKQRVLIVEGSLKYRDHNNARVSQVATTYSYHAKLMTHTVQKAGYSLLYTQPIVQLFSGYKLADNCSTYKNVMCKLITISLQL